MSACRRARSRVVLLSEAAISARELERFLAEARPAEVVVVAPALTGFVHRRASDTEAERRAARDRLERLLRELGGRGVEATGEVGDADPLQAIDDACRIHRPDAVVIPCRAPGAASRRARSLAARGRRLAVPIRELAAEQAEPPRPEAA